tara:strand:- start:390 stop:656 length:267 start_codon:yes stop_codon:yes gene_type:complete
MENANDKLIFNNSGKKIKKLKEGITINRVELDKSIIFCVLLVSQYNQIKAKKVVKGIETINPASKDDRLAISETITITKAVIIVLMNK